MHRLHPPIPSLSMSMSFINRLSSKPHAISKQTSVHPTSSSSRPDLSGIKPSVSPSSRYQCEDSAVAFRWLNGMMIVCLWVADHVELTCSEAVAQIKCPKSCRVCESSLMSSVPSSNTPTYKPRSFPDSSMSMSYINRPSSKPHAISKQLSASKLFDY